MDEIVGSFRDVHITGLGSDRDAQLVFDYEDDVVSLLVTAEGQGSGEVDVSLLEEATPASGVDTLLQALTSGLPNVNDELYPEVVSVGGNGVLEFL